MKGASAARVGSSGPAPRKQAERLAGEAARSASTRACGPGRDAPCSPARLGAQRSDRLQQPKCRGVLRMLLLGFALLAPRALHWQGCTLRSSPRLLGCRWGSLQTLHGSRASSTLWQSRRRCWCWGRGGTFEAQAVGRGPSTPPHPLPREMRLLTSCAHLLRSCPACAAPQALVLEAEEKLDKGGMQRLQVRCAAPCCAALRPALALWSSLLSARALEPVRLGVGVGAGLGASLPPGGCGCRGGWPGHMPGERAQHSSACRPRRRRPFTRSPLPP